MVNKVMLIGNVGADPEVKSFTNGGRVANLSVATSERWKDKTTGEKKEKTEWHRVCIFVDGLINVVESYVKKGDKIYLEGQIETRSWEQDGQKKYATEVVLRPFNSSLALLSNKSDSGQPTPAATPAAAVEDDDEIPF